MISTQVRGRFKLFARAADAATSQKCAAMLPDDAKSVVSGAALLGRDVAARNFRRDERHGARVATCLLYTSPSPRDRG